VKSKDSTKVIKDHKCILSRWAEHLKELLDCVNPTDPTLVDLIPQLPIIPQLGHLPAFYEVEVAVKGLKNNKSAGPDGIRMLRFSNMEVTILSTDCISLFTVLGPQGSYHSNGKMPPL